MNANEIDSSAPLIGEDFSGRTIGKLTILRFAGVRCRSQRRKVWLCRCACGTEKLIPQTYFVNRNVVSCGCVGKERRLKACTKHGFAHARAAHPVYTKWQGMIKRCTKPDDKAWQWYGARGIKVCERWLHSFENFRDDMFATWKRGLTLERKDPNGDYEPKNCVWATSLQQANNKRNTRRFEWLGRSMTIPQWATEYGISEHTLYHRVRHMGWPLSKAITTPVKFNPRWHDTPPA